jgi:hypothetical protein
MTDKPYRASSNRESGCRTCRTPLGVTVKVNASLLPPLSQPRSPERLAGVCTTIWAVPGDEIWVVVIAACSWVLLRTVMGQCRSVP